MTWSVSASGTKDAAKEMIERQVHESHAAVRGALKTLVDDMGGSYVYVNGSGSGVSMTLCISSWNEVAAAAA